MLIVHHRRRCMTWRKTNAKVRTVFQVIIERSYACILCALVVWKQDTHDLLGIIGDLQCMEPVGCCLHVIGFQLGGQATLSRGHPPIERGLHQGTPIPTRDYHLVKGPPTHCTGPQSRYHQARVSSFDTKTLALLYEVKIVDRHLRHMTEFIGMEQVDWTSNFLKMVTVSMTKMMACLCSGGYTLCIGRDYHSSQQHRQLSSNLNASISDLKAMMMKAMIKVFDGPKLVLKRKGDVYKIETLKMLTLLTAGL